MMYQALAKYYDALVKDEEATKHWVDFIKREIPIGNLCELACGSGEITIALAKEGYRVHASDLSEEMVLEARKKAGSELVMWSVMDMCHMVDDQRYDGIVCLCDSFNYLLHESQVDQLFQGVYDHLVDKGIFILDMHSMDRLTEFEEEYNEAGKVLGHEYQWTIVADEDRIYQNFAFFDDSGRVTLEQHIQRVYSPLWMIEKLEALGFDVGVKTDFDEEGIVPGEKQFLIAKKIN